MIKSRAIRWMLVIFSIQSILFATGTGAEGTILCIGGNGHIGIETVQQCGNQDSLGGKTIAVGPSVPVQDDCGPCIDLPLNSGPFLTASALQSVSPVVDAVLCSSPASSIAAINVQPLSFQPGFNVKTVPVSIVNVLRI